MKGGEAYARMNFLYQAAYACVFTSPALARFYVRTMKLIARKMVLRLDPSIKRSVCKKCNNLLVPGYTATIRCRAMQESHIVVTCCFCGEVKRFSLINRQKKKARHHRRREG